MHRVFKLILPTLLAISFLSILFLSAVQATPPQQTSNGPRLRLAIGEFSPDPNQIQLSSAPEPSHLTLSAYPDDGTGYYLVQFSGPILVSDQAALTQAGAEIFDYVADFAYIVKMNDATRTLIEGLPQIHWVGIYQPSYRLAPDLLSQAVDNSDINPGTLPEGSFVFKNEDPIEMVVIVFRGEPLAPIIDQIETLGGQVLEQQQTTWQSMLRISLAPNQLSALVNMSGISWIEPVVEYQIFNGPATDIIGAREVWDTHGLYGQGQIIGVADTGLDQGSTSPASLHDDFEDGNGNSRVLQIFDRVGDGANDVRTGHGTHVAGSVLGNGDLSGATPSTHTYPNTSHAGAAPEASLVFQAVEDNGTGELSGLADLNGLFTQAANAGAKIHNNSWGSNVEGMYSSDSMILDQFVWDNPDFSVLVAGGNDGVDADSDGLVDLYSMGAPATAKNAITVGASENNQSAFNAFSWSGYVSPIGTDSPADNPAGLAPFSSRGPTLDGRYKPDIVAPGTFIASTRSSMSSSTGWFPIDDDYMYNGGTSMATPIAAGGTAIIRQYFEDNENITPSAALIKASLVNGTVDISPGQYGTGATQEIPDARPNNVAGWGRIDIEQSIFPTAPRVMTYTDETTGLDTSETHTYNYYIDSSDQPFNITLNWSDYPGALTSNGSLVNDLDLKLEKPDGSFVYPNNPIKHGGLQHLFYDDWVIGLFSTSSISVAVRFTPTSYPVNLQSTVVYLRSSTNSYPKIYNWYIYTSGSDATGPTSTPVAQGTISAQREGWHALDLSGLGIEITGGDFFIALNNGGDTDARLYLDVGSSDVRTWVLSGSWNKFASGDLLLHAIVSSPDETTEQDRANNLVGIDLESPNTGLYTVTVEGHNVPFGPQPYALVASGILTGIPTPPSNPSLSIEKSAATNVASGGLLTYTLVVRNDGTGTATNAMITDTVPASTTLLASSLSGDATYGGAEAGQPIQWNTGVSLDPLDALTRTFVVTADRTFVNSEIVNTAYVSASNVVTIATSSVTTTLIAEVIPTPSLSLEKLAATNVESGGLLTYTLVVRNNGTGTATNVMITDTVPTSTTLLASSLSGDATYSGTQAGQHIQWHTGVSLAQDVALTRTFVVTVDSAVTDGQIENTAYVSASNVASITMSSITTTFSGGVSLSELYIYLPSVLKK